MSYKLTQEDLNKVKDPYIRLAMAIVLFGVQEYDYAVKGLKKNPNATHYRAMVQEIDRFFDSEWFGLLCDVDPSLIKKHIKYGG